MTMKWHSVRKIAVTAWIAVAAIGGVIVCPAIAAAEGSEAGTPAEHRIAVWLDTDIGGDIDDAVCLLCAIRHPQIKLVGVSTVHGCIGSIQAAAWLARTMLDRAGRPKVPVLPGMRGSLDGSGVYDGRGSYGVLAPPFDPLPATPAADNARIDAIAAAMRAANEPFYVVAVGPLSNVARLALRHPDVAGNWQGVICMAGRLTGEAECNVRIDADAARTVAEKLKPRLVGTEAMGRAIPRDLVEATLDKNDPASAFLLECYQQYRIHTARPGELPDQRRLTISDPVTLLSLVRPDLFRLESIRIAIEADGRMHRSKTGAAVQYAAWSNHAALERLMLELFRSKRKGISRRGAETQR